MTDFRRRIVCGLLAIGLLANTSPVVYGQGLESQVVAKTGDAAPGTGGLVFGVPTGAPDAFGFGASSVNAAGALTFGGRVNGTGVTATVNDIGLWARPAGGAITLLARNGDAAPGSGGAVYGTNASATGLGAAAIDAGGTVAFRSGLTGTGVTTANDIGLFVGAPGNVQLLARRGDQAGGLPTGAVYGSATGGFADPLLTSNGRAFFSSALSGTGVTTANDSALFLGSPGAVAPVVRKGDAAPGTGGATFSSVNGAFAVNPSERFVFRGALVTGGSVNATNNVAAWGGTAGNVALLQRNGDAAPGIGNVIAGTGLVSVLANNRFLVAATITQGGAVTTSNDTALYVGTQQANMALAVREGSQVPGQAGGVVLAGLGVPVVNGNSFASRTIISGPGVTAAVNDRVIYAWTDGVGVRLVARQGSAAPGTGGAVFGAIGTSNSATGLGVVPVVATNGTVAFLAPLTGTGVTTATDVGLYVEVAGSLSLVARKGDVINLGTASAPDNATIAQLLISENPFFNQNGYSPVADPTQFSQSPLLSWSALFTDGRSATFVAVPVPEPASALGLVAVAGLIARYSRRRGTPGS